MWLLVLPKVFLNTFETSVDHLIILLYITELQTTYYLNQKLQFLAADALLGPEPGKPVMVDGALVAPKRGGKKRPQKVGRASVRNELRKRGVRAFLVRVVAADAIVKLGDTSGDNGAGHEHLLVRDD